MRKMADVVAEARSKLEGALYNAELSGNTTKIAFAKQALAEHDAAVKAMAPMFESLDEMNALKEQGL